MAEEDDGEHTAIEQQLEHAISSRIHHFKDQADSLTMESVRRLLEKDLGFEKFALDAHKRFIRLYLEKKMDAGDEYNTKTESENTDKDAYLNKEEAAMSPKLHETKSNMRKSSSGDEEMMEDSPIMGILTPKSEADTKASPVSESGIKKAIWKRADHFLANSENITLAGVRRLLEEDLRVAKNTLDSYKKFISQEIDQVLNPPKVDKSMKDIKKKHFENVRSKKSKESSCDESNSSGSESDKEMEDKVKSRKKPASRRTIKNVKPTKKRKTSEREIDVSGKGSKSAKRQKGEDNESDVDGNLSEGDQFQSSNEKSAQRKDKSTTAYGKQVERLKSIIKACGMSVAPVIYKKAKQVPENKREAFIVKELEDILSKEGLSTNPNEKEMKDCKKRKETARELEGIDMSNILSSSRRRSTFSFTTHVKPVICSKKDKVAAKESKSKDSDDKGQNNDNEEDEKNEENEKKKNEKVEKKVDEKEEGEGKIEEKNDDEDDEGEEDSEEDEEESESEEFNEDDSD